MPQLLVALTLLFLSAAPQPRPDGKLVFTSSVDPTAAGQFTCRLDTGKCGFWDVVAGAARTIASTADAAAAVNEATVRAALALSAGAVTTNGQNLTTGLITSGLVNGIDIPARDAVLTSTTATANAACPKDACPATGAWTSTGTWDGRDVSTDGAALDAAAPSLALLADTGASLRLGSTTRAVLLPVMTTAQRDALTATDGQLIWNSTTGELNQYDGAWIAVGITDHGGLTGLADNDHPQYALLAGATFSGAVTHSNTTAMNGAVTVADDTNLCFGTDADWCCKYDEATDNRIECTASVPGKVLALSNGGVKIAVAGFNSPLAVYDSDNITSERFRVDTSIDMIKGTAAEGWAPTEYAIDTVLTNTDLTRYIYCTAAGVDITLPDASGTGRLIYVKCLAGTCTVVGDGSDTLEQGPIGTETTLTTAGDDVELQDRANEIWSVTRAQ